MGNRTSFKKGEKHANYRPIGSEKVKDGIVRVKIAENKWQTKQKYVWEKAHGKVPNGFVVIFGDKDKTNFDLYNLLLVSRKQLVVLNKFGLIKNDVELTKVGITIADLIMKTHSVERD